MNYLQLLSINILNSRYKFIFSIIVYLLVYFFYYTNIAYNMGNCFSNTSVEENSLLLNPYTNMTFQAMQAENIALNQSINDLHQRISDINIQLHQSNEICTQQYKTIQTLLANQEQMKKQLISLETKLSAYETKQSFLHEQLISCQR